MFERFKRLRLLYIVLGMLLVVGLVPLGMAGWMLSGRSADELRSVEGRYQAQLVQDKARQIELYGQRYRDVVTGLARAFELTGGVRALVEAGSDSRLQKAVEDDQNLIALAIMPVAGNPHMAYKPDAIARDEVNARVNETLARMSERGLIISDPHVIRSSQEMGLTVAAPVMGGSDGTEVIAAVVAIVSFREVFAAVQQQVSMSESELLERGLPVIFVVNRDGRAVAHPDARVAFAERTMLDLKVVQEWIASGRQVKSALAPFTAERDGREVKMLGAYATARLDEDARLGVIAIQDERAALQSVAVMRRQTFFISLLAATFALLIGFLFAKQLTRPVHELAEGAHRIAGGDFSQRIDVRSRTELGDLGKSFNRMTDQLEHYIEDLRRAADENRQLFLGTVKALAAAIDGKDPYTRGHSERVARFSIAIGERLDLPDDELEKLRISALLHDVGKISIDDAILKKPAALTDEEYEIMKQHPQKGFKIMSQIPAMRDFLPGMYMHHEMMDGRGYPQGLSGDEIPTQARIVSVADTFDAMTTDRPYQRGMKIEEALERIKTFVGTRYDKRVVAALVEACESGQITPGRVRLSRRAKELANPSASKLPAAAPPAPVAGQTPTL
ncbi:MAG TPA: HD domain-containing phosphohydrolase [Pyrinomonadaceae bacterium]|jgi:HD-GYP domain-containing protein (c-di-GMP phosphodiesterase class II)|nr:HD domain-containing phosphohydrolase [Pyrinomonadaceae bacterium]